MLYKLTKTIIFLTILTITFSCRMPTNFGFYQPITLDLTVPDGPPEFKAGWYAGCNSALGNKYFANTFVYGGKSGIDYGSGIYQHDPVYQAAWGRAFFTCNIHAATFSGLPSLQHGPLQ